MINQIIDYKKSKWNNDKLYKQNENLYSYYYHFSKQQNFYIYQLAQIGFDYLNYLKMTPRQCVEMFNIRDLADKEEKKAIAKANKKNK